MIKTDTLLSAGRQKTAGFSLIEVLFAMLFLSVIIFGVIKLQTSNLTLSNTKQLELKAHSYAMQAMEIVSALGLAKIQGCNDDDNKTCYLTQSGDDYDIAEGGSESIDGLFQRTLTHDEPTELKNASLVTATVKWTDSSGDHEVSAKRVIF